MPGFLKSKPKKQRKVEHILLVEDDERVRDMLGRLLQLDGHIVSEASNGEEAVAKVEAEEFDAVFMDVKMPKMDGVTAYREMSAGIIPRNIIFMTAFPRDATLEAVLQEGKVEYLQKPCTLQALRETLGRLSSKQDDKAGKPQYSGEENW